MHWLLLGAAMVGLFAWRVLRARGRRTRGLRRLAMQARLNYSPEDLIGLHDRYYNLRLIRTGHSRSVCDTVYGSTRQGLLALFRYSAELGFGAQQARQNWWIAVLESPEPRATCIGFGAPDGAAGIPAEHYPHLLEVKGWRVHYRHRGDRAILENRAVLDLLPGWPADWAFEASGRIVLVRAPDKGEETAQRVLEAVQVLGPALAGG